MTFDGKDLEEKKEREPFNKLIENFLNKCEEEKIKYLKDKLNKKKKKIKITNEYKEKK